MSSIACEQGHKAQPGKGSVSEEGAIADCTESTRDHPSGQWKTMTATTGRHSALPREQGWVRHRRFLCIVRASELGGGQARALRSKVCDINDEERVAPD